MTRITQRHVIQQVDDDLVFIDEQSGAEVLKPVAEAQLLLDGFRVSAELDEPLIVANADSDEQWFVPADDFPAVERALNYFIDNSGVRQARAIDTSGFGQG